MKRYLDVTFGQIANEKKSGIGGKKTSVYQKNRVSLFNCLTGGQ